MLETHPNVKYIRICEKTDLFGNPVEALIIDTNITINENHNIQSDARLIDLAVNIKEFQMNFKKLFGSFKQVEVLGNKKLLFNAAT